MDLEEQRRKLLEIYVEQWATRTKIMIDTTTELGLCESERHMFQQESDRYAVLLQRSIGETLNAEELADLETPSSLFKAASQLQHALWATLADSHIQDSARVLSLKHDFDGALYSMESSVKLAYHVGQGNERAISIVQKSIEQLNSERDKGM